MLELYAALPEKPEWLTGAGHSPLCPAHGRLWTGNRNTSPGGADGPTLYREALALSDRALRESVVYGYLRDRDTDYDSAREELAPP